MEQNVCKKPGEQFMWKAIMSDSNIVTEFDENNNTNDILKEVMGNEKLCKFGLCGNGYYSSFDAETGIFTLFNGTDTLEVRIYIDDNNIMGGNNIRNKVIHFRTAESLFEPSVGGSIDKIFRYSFGYKTEDQHAFIRTIVAFDMYKSILLQMSITGKIDTVCIFEFIINGKTVAKQPIQLEKNIRKELEIPLSMAKINK